MGVAVDCRMLLQFVAQRDSLNSVQFQSLLVSENHSVVDIVAKTRHSLDKYFLEICIDQQEKAWCRLCIDRCPLVGCPQEFESSSHSIECTTTLISSHSSTPRYFQATACCRHQMNAGGCKRTYSTTNNRASKHRRCTRQLTTFTHSDNCERVALVPKPIPSVSMLHAEKQEGLVHEVTCVRRSQRNAVSAKGRLWKLPVLSVRIWKKFFGTLIVS